MYSRRYRSTRADPRIPLDVHAICDQRKVRVVVVVAGAAEIAVLRKDDVGVDLNGRRVIDLHAIAGCDMVRADEVPGGPHLGGRIEVAIVSQRGSKEPQQGCTPGMHRSRRRAVEQKPADIPDKPAEAVAEAERRPRVSVRMALGGDVVGGAIVCLAGHSSVSLGNGRRGWLRLKLLKRTQGESHVPADR